MPQSIESQRYQQISIANSVRKSIERLQEIGEPPLTLAQKARGNVLRRRCHRDLLAFNQICFPGSTGLKPFGTVQVKSIGIDQEIILHGGKAQKLEPRGYAKTTRSVNAAIWGVLFGHRKFIVVITASMRKSEDIIRAWKTELVNNDDLYCMFPRICWPLRKLDNKPIRCAGQVYNGFSTYTRWANDTLVLPTLDGVCTGVLVSIPMDNARGISHRSMDGAVFRPELVIMDDVQTDESAGSAPTISRMMTTMKKSVLRLGGHDRTLSVINNATPIKVGDMTDIIASDPSWQTVRYKMLMSRAKNEKLWLGFEDPEVPCYKDLLLDFDSEKPDSETAAKVKAREFYEANREAMDEGAEVSWEWAYAWNDEIVTEISAIQHAYNILIREGEEVFASECQSTPQSHSAETGQLMSVQEIAAKISRVPRFVLPAPSVKLVAHVDVQESCLIYAVVASSDTYQASMVDAGIWPPQPAQYYDTLKKLPNPFDRQYPNQQLKAQIYAGLRDLKDHLESIRWIREDGAEFDFDLILADARYETDTVKKFCRESGKTWLPAMGFGVKASNKPWDQLAVKEGDTSGHHWQYRAPNIGPPLMYLRIDANYWKTQVHALLKARENSDAYLTLYEAESYEHLMTAEHCRAEYPTDTEGHGRKLQEWNPMPGRSETRNDRFDNLTGVLAGLSYLGCRLPEGGEIVARKGKIRKKISFRAKQAR